MSGRDEEVREVVSELDGLLAQLRENVKALNSILTPPGEDAPGKELTPHDDAKT